MEVFLEVALDTDFNTSAVTVGGALDLGADLAADLGRTSAVTVGGALDLGADLAADLAAAVVGLRRLGVGETVGTPFRLVRLESRRSAACRLASPCAMARPR